MDAQILEVRVLPGEQPEVLGEYELRPGLSPEAAARAWPAGVGRDWPRLLPAFAALHRGLEADRELTGIRRVRVVTGVPVAARLEPGSESGTAVAAVALPALAAGPRWAAWLADLLQAQALYPGPQDTRLPRRFAPLAGVVAPLRRLLEQMRRQVQEQPHLRAELLAPLETDPEAAPRLDPHGQTRHLLSRFLSRQDWRERDVLLLLLDFLQDSPILYAEPVRHTWFSLKRLQDEDPPAYNRVLAALINEGRGHLGDLPRWRRLCRLKSAGRPGPWDAIDVRLVYRAMAGLLELGPEATAALDAPAAQDTFDWQILKEAALQQWGHRVINWKALEKASLFLAAAFFPENAGLWRFCRYLLEQEEPYRQLLAACYAPPAEQQAQLARLMAGFNHHPANIETPVSLEPHQAEHFLRLFFLRPDPVEAIIDREWQKDLYHTLAGLGGQALLPQVLHECQKIFGYVTPAAADRVAGGLKVSPSEIVRVIASYQEFSADPAGRLVVHVCKGTACFLRGQPHLSRAMSSRLGAPEGRVSPEGLQFLERDCFGVCHLAPVLKVGSTFLGQVEPAAIPGIVSQLLRGRTYENRQDFFMAVRDSLAEEDQVELPQAFRVQAALQLEEAPARLTGLIVNGLGEIHSLPGRRLLGVLVERCYPFTYGDTTGAGQYGCLVVDEDDFLMGAVNAPDPAVQGGLRRTCRPRVLLRENQVFLEGLAAPLGDYHSGGIALKKPDGAFGALFFAEDNRQAPQEPPGLAEPARRPPPPEFFRRQDRVLLGWVEGVNPDSIDSYLEKGGYQALKKVLGYGQTEKYWAPTDIVIEIERANLRGRGGAGFPTGRKWREMLQAQPQTRPGDEVAADLKLLVANGDEGDPGAFMDRTLIQERPHQLLEGMLIAALATGCRYGVIYVRKEYEDAVQRLENAVFEARRYGFLGRRVLGRPDFYFDVEIRLGAGAFVAGEKRAIMRAIEGKAAEPDLKAVSNVRRGLWGKPTLLNNVETFANIPLILSRGGAWFRDLGYGASGGSKLFSVAGIVHHTGLVEVRFGRTLRDILNIAGGVQEGKALAGVQIGGPSGAILALTGIRAYLLDLPLDFDTFNRVGAMIGSGGLVFLGEDDDVVRLARHFTDWLARESCGQCPPCRDGLVSLGATLDRILKGEGAALDLHLLWAQADLIRAGSHCGLGRTAPNPVTSSLRFFPVSYLHYLFDNPRFDDLELFQVLEALRLLTREESPGRFTFTLKKGLIKFILEELKTRERYRPAPAGRPQRFLQLLRLSPGEVGLKGVRREYSQEILAQHRSLMIGELTAGFNRGRGSHDVF